MGCASMLRQIDALDSSAGLQDATPVRHHPPRDSLLHSRVPAVRGAVRRGRCGQSQFEGRAVARASVYAPRLCATLVGLAPYAHSEKSDLDRLVHLPHHGARSDDAPPGTDGDSCLADLCERGCDGLVHRWGAVVGGSHLPSPSARDWQSTRTC